jgi:hypothetical protein
MKKEQKKAKRVCEWQVFVRRRRGGMWFSDQYTFIDRPLFQRKFLYYAYYVKMRNCTFVS